ncbi:hypothetical protein QOT17_022815 [Balamuthia mandrillaris]
MQRNVCNSGFAWFWLYSRKQLLSICHKKSTPRGRPFQQTLHTYIKLERTDTTLDQSQCWDKKMVSGVASLAPFASTPPVTAVVFGVLRTSFFILSSQQQPNTTRLQCFKTKEMHAAIMANKKLKKTGC